MNERRPFNPRPNRGFRSPIISNKFVTFLSSVDGPELDLICCVVRRTRHQLGAKFSDDKVHRRSACDDSSPNGSCCSSQHCSSTVSLAPNDIPSFNRFCTTVVLVVFQKLYKIRKAAAVGKRFS
jgi:hypothetical protein